MRNLAIELPLAAMADYCRRWRIVRLEVFGSVLRDDFRADSDIDFLVTWEPGVEWSWGEFMCAREELASIVGRQIDFIERTAIEQGPNWIRRQDILGTARVIHAA